MDQRKVRAIICEDEPLVGIVIERELERIGLEVIGRASDGQGAVTLAQALKPDIIIMDIALPEMDGIDAARVIMERCPTPVVIMSGYDTPELSARAAAAGVGAYLIKPPDPEELDRAITIARARFADLIELRRLNADLQEALATVRTLRGMLPVCSGCKKIRDREGKWQRMEAYLGAHTQATFTHGLCPDCEGKYFPEGEAGKK